MPKVRKKINQELVGHLRWEANLDSVFILYIPKYIIENLGDIKIVTGLYPVKMYHCELWQVFLLMSKFKESSSILGLYPKTAEA